jgi:hypothetical protein
MFNVYACKITYTRTPKDGVMAGIPVNCTFGVADEQEGKLHFESLVRDNPGIIFSNYQFHKK